MTSNIGLLDGLRLICGAFFIPHLVLKFVFFNDTVAFFKRAGIPLQKPAIFLDAVVEIIVATMLIVNVYTGFAAILAAIHLSIAGVAVWRANGHTWRWNRGGPEYPLFWALMCLLVAHGYQL